MIQRYISLLIQDDNPRLHRIPFLLFWIASYGLVWLWIYFGIEHSVRGFGNFSCWLRDGYSSPRQDIFVGVVVGSTLFIVQRWLLQKRYGYVPKYWGIATIIGGFISGFGYPLLAQGIVRPFVKTDDMILWFCAISVFQAVAMLHTNRRGWLIALVGIVAMLFINVNLILNMRYIRFAFILSTAIQAVGTGLVMLYLMGNPRQGIVPKRNEEAKLYDHIPLHIFFILWIAIFYIGLAGVVVVEEMLDTFKYGIHLDALWWNRGLPFSITFGILLGISQQWLIGKYLGRTIRHWFWFTFFGWLIVGCLSLVIVDLTVLRLLWLIIPILMQAIAILKVMSRAWIWISGGIVVVLVEFIVFTLDRFYFEYTSTWFDPVTTIAIVTSIALLLMTSFSEKKKTQH